jgi:hypothetical protein
MRNVDMANLQELHLGPGQVCLAQVYPLQVESSGGANSTRWHLTPTTYAVVVRRALPAIETLVRQVEKVDSYACFPPGIVRRFSRGDAPRSFVSDDGSGRNVMVHKSGNTDFRDGYLRKSAIL